MENTIRSGETDRSCIVIGAGVSGLAAAYWLAKEGFDVTVLERDSEPGGAMKTIRKDGYLIDTGPNSALETTPLFDELFNALGIIDRRVYANERSSKRYILRGGRLHPLPMSPGAFIGSGLWSVGGKLRLLKEPFVRRASAEESIAQFVERRLGREFLDYAINPFVAGVYAGNPEDLSVRMAFPKLYRLEEVYGGLIKGMIRGRKERKQRAEQSKQNAKMFSFIDGMGTFPRALAESIGNRLSLNTSVVSLEQTGDTYAVHTQTPSGERTWSAARVVLAVPAFHAASILSGFYSTLLSALTDIHYPPVAMVYFGYDRQKIPRQLDGFGFLVPEKEKRKILGSIWSSVLFPERAPGGCAAFTTFVGGSRQPEYAELADDRLADLVHEELSSILGAREYPDFYYIRRWKRAIPQYTLGYAEVIKRIEKFERTQKGLYLCANYRGGIAVGDCVMSARRTVDRIVSEAV